MLSCHLAPWTGRAVFRGCRIKRFAKINAWNRERRLEQCGRDTVEWDTITTGNFGGFDVWLSEDDGAQLDLTTNRGSIQEKLEAIGLEDIITVSYTHLTLPTKA